MDDSSSREPVEPPGLALSGFGTAPADGGLSLEKLNDAFAQMLSHGDDPYRAELPPGDEGVPGAAQDDWPDEHPVDVHPRSILEAMLFVGNRDNEPLTSETIAALMRGVRPAEVDELVRELNRGYDEQGCPYHIASVGAGYRMVLREEYEALRDKFYGRVRQARLSQAAVETLALVAYNGPLSADAIAKLRGRPLGGVLAQLVRRQLLATERDPEHPRCLLYRTTARFLDLFRLERLEDLPRGQELEKS